MLDERIAERAARRSETLPGLPFVGPAGRLLERALEAAGVEREQIYITNAVKHFKWQLRGKRRLHKTPAQREIEACRRWLEGEIRIRRRCSDYGMKRKGKALSTGWWKTCA